MCVVAAAARGVAAAQQPGTELRDLVRVSGRGGQLLPDRRVGLAVRVQRGEVPPAERDQIGGRRRRGATGGVSRPGGPGRRRGRRGGWRTGAVPAWPGAGG